MNSLLLWTVAAVSMVLDHVGIILWPEAEVLRYMGRVAWPCFALLAAHGARTSSDPAAYALRLLGCGIVTQPVYWWAFGPVFQFNIFFTLALGVWLHVTLRNPNAWHQIAALAASVVVPVEYGTWGAMTVVWASITHFSGKPILWLAWPLVGVLGDINLRMATLGGSLLAATYNGQRGPVVWKWWRYIFYPAHLVCIAAFK